MTRHPCRFAVAILLALVLGACTSLPAPQSHNTVLLISIDGLRADAVGSDAMPTLNRLATGGVQADWMNPSYPSLTFPNHYTLVTGLRPDHHGIVNNTMRDPVLGRFSLGNRAAVEDARWWGGEPIWVTLQKHGGHAATMFWPGSEAAIAGQYPDVWRSFDATVPPNGRVDQVLAWLAQPAPQRPRFITLYFDQVDHAGHAHGPRSAESAAAMREVDDALARLVAGIDTRGLRNSVDLIVVSDHGMAQIAPGHRIYLDDYLGDAHLPMSAIDLVTRGQVVGIIPRQSDAAAVANAVLGKHAHAECWRKNELPARWHYGTHPRIPPIVCQADPGWELSTRSDPGKPDGLRGGHGYDPDAPDMHAVFVASGPDFARGVRIGAFDNVDVYPLLAALLGIPAQHNDGDIRPLLPALDRQGRELVPASQKKPPARP